jgi:hypothetical protein
LPGWRFINKGCPLGRGTTYRNTAFRCPAREKVAKQLPERPRITFPRLVRLCLYSVRANSMEILILTTEDANQRWRLRRPALGSDPEAFRPLATNIGGSACKTSAPDLVPGRTRLIRRRCPKDARFAGLAGFYRETGAKTRHRGPDLGCLGHARTSGWNWPQASPTLLERARAIGGLDQIHRSVTSAQAAAPQLYEEFATGPQFPSNSAARIRAASGFRAPNRPIDPAPAGPRARFPPPRLWSAPGSNSVAAMLLNRLRRSADSNFKPMR